MGNETYQNLRSAQQLYRETHAADLKYGCVEICLEALGGSTHLVELLNGNPTERSSLFSILSRRGFKTGWIVRIPVDATAEDMEDILEGKALPLQFPSKGRLAGFLGLESYPNEAQPNHVIAIIPRQYMSRNHRRTFKKKCSYLVIDTTAGGALPVTSMGLANHAKHVINSGGFFSIARLEN